MIEDLTRPLLAFWVGDFGIYAAQDEAQALALAKGMGITPGELKIEDVSPVGADTLDTRLAGEGGEPLAWTLRGLLHATKEPGFLAGYEQ